DWKIFHGVHPAQPEALQTRIRRIADVLERIHFASPPKLKLNVRGDARDMEKLDVRMSMSAPDADTPWGKLSDVKWSVMLAPPPGSELSRAEIKLTAADADTPWHTIKNLALVAHMSLAESNTNLVHVDVDL